MVVRSESGDGLDCIQLSPDPAASPGSPQTPGSPESKQLIDSLKKGTKRIFPLYDNISRTVKRHREKSREREKSRDRVKQRERLRLMEEEELMKTKEEEEKGTEEGRDEIDGDEERGRGKTKEKKRFYQREKSKEKKKNKDKEKEKGAGSKTPESAAPVSGETPDESRDNSVYGSVAPQPLAGASASVAASEREDGGLVYSTQQQSSLSGSSGDSSPLTSLETRGSDDLCADTEPGLYGSPAAPPRYFTLEGPPTSRRTPEHDYETVDSVRSGVTQDGAQLQPCPVTAAADTAAAAAAEPGQSAAGGRGDQTDTSDSADKASAAHEPGARSALTSTETEPVVHAAAAADSSEKVKHSRKFLSFNARNESSAKWSFLSSLLRTDEAVTDVLPEAASQTRTVNSVSSKTRSLPSKYRDLWRDRASSGGGNKQCGENGASAILPTPAGDRPEEMTQLKDNSPQTVEIELPGVFGSSQMRASLRITLKNSDNSRSADSKLVRKDSGRRLRTAKWDDGEKSCAASGKRVNTGQGEVRLRSRQRKNSAENRLSVAIPPETVAALTSKFNALIASTSAESSPSPTGTKTFNLGSITVNRSGNVSKSSSFRRSGAEACRSSVRRRLSASHPERTDSLVRKASAALSRQVSSGQVRSAEEPVPSSRPSSKPSSKPSSRSSSFRRVSVRSSNRRRAASSRNVAADQKAVSASDRPAGSMEPRKTASLGRVTWLGDSDKAKNRNKPQVSRVQDRELRKITNSGAVAKTSELLLKRALSNSTQEAAKKGSAPLTYPSLRFSGTTKSNTDKPGQKTGDKKAEPNKLVASKVSIYESAKVKPSTLDQKTRASSENDIEGSEVDSKTDSSEKQEVKKESKKATSSDYQKGETDKKADCKIRTTERTENRSGPVGNRYTPRYERLTVTSRAPNMSIENRLYGDVSFVARRNGGLLIENRLYGSPLDFRSRREAPVSRLFRSDAHISPASSSAHTVSVNKTPSLKSLPLAGQSSQSRGSMKVREAISIFETSSSSTDSLTPPRPAGQAQKSATLPSRVPPLPPASHRAVPGTMPDGYESIWSGHREYKPNASFLWHGSSQLTSAGESAGSGTSSFSDRDTASLSDASSAPDEEAAGRLSLWRRLGLTRPVGRRSDPTQPDPPPPPADYDHGGSSSSGTVTYENGSDAGYERINSGDSNAGYEQIGSRYERIGQPPSETTSAGYETLAPPSETSTLCYDDCVLPARLALVSEHQLESIRYVDSGSAQYEDIGGGWTQQTPSAGRQHEYLRIVPSYNCDELPEDDADGSEEGGPQTVNSYQLTEFGTDGQMAVASHHQVSLPSTPRERAASDRDTGGEWTDIDADGEQYSDDTEGSTDSPIVVTRPHFVRLRNRSRRFSKTRAGRRSWSQSLRDLANDPDLTDGPWRHTLAGGETDEEWLDDGHLYEALDSHYEPVETVPEAADDSDNTAGSDEEDDAEPEEDDDEKEGDENGEVLDQDQRANGIQKFAEAADEVRKRLAKNWNLTKSDIRSGISRIRKKSSSGPETPVSVVVKPKWSLRNHLRKKKGAAGSSASLSGGAGAGDAGEKSTFYLDLVIQPNQSRPLSETGPPGSQDDSAEVRSESDPGSTRSSVRRSDTDSIYGVLPAAAVDSRARARLSSTQSTSSRESAHSSRKLSSAGSVRPRTAPPAPPVANSPHSPTRTQHEPSSPPGFTRSMSTQLQQSVRPLAACRQSGSLDGDLTRLPARAAPALPRLQRSSVSLVETELYRPAASSSHDNSEYMMSAGERTGASEAEGEEQRREEEEEQYTSLLDKEPLYQVYLRDRCYQDSVSGSSEDDYETIREAAPGSDPAPSDPPSPLPSVPSAGEPPPDVVPPPPPPARRRLHSRPSAMELVSAPVEGQRSLWCQLPEVINSGVLDTLSSEEKRLQEAMFELISSEASYLKSLTVLVRHFSEDPQLCHFHSPDCVLSKADFQDLFSNADKVRQCSERFLADLERTWQENVMLHGVCDVIQDHATNHFHVYKHYCANQIIQDRKLKELREKSAGFVEVLRRLESSSQCQSLSLHSFLMLPMQRATRLPLLVSAILVKLEPGHAQYTSCQRAYQTLTRLVKDCNEEARKNERLEELVTLSRQLVFRDIKSFPLVTRDRWLVKKGELMRTVYKSDDSKLTFGRRQSRQQAVHLFLFNDLLIIAKRKAEDSYVVLDYCLRNMVQLTENAEERPDRFLLTLLSNHEAKTVEMLFSCPVESERVRWVEAVTPRGHSSGSETVYESWDCPQVQAVHPYTAQQPDELTLHVGDVLKVLRKVPDGWNQGMRLSDSALGWFPSNRCREIMSEHVRARHLRQRYQVLKITGEYLRQERERKLRSDRETS